MGIVSAGELFEVSDVELRCIIAQPSTNVSKCGYGHVQENLYDLGPHWTEANDIWQGEPSLVALYFTGNPIQSSAVQLFDGLGMSTWVLCVCEMQEVSLALLVVEFGSIYVIQ